MKRILDKFAGKAAVLALSIQSMTGCLAESPPNEVAEQTSALTTNGFGPVKSILSSRCLSVDSSSTADGAQIIQWTCLGMNAQEWTFSPDPADTTGTLFFIKNLNSNKCLSVDSNSTADGARVIQWNCIGSSGQKWSILFSALETGVRIVNHSGKCLSVDSSSTSNGARIIQWRCIPDSLAQQWQ